MKIYLLYSCDEWKDRSSMRLLMATACIDKLKNAFVKEVTNQDMDYSSDFRDEQICRLQNDLESMKIESINDLLKYGFIDIVADGEYLH